MVRQKIEDAARRYWTRFLLEGKGWSAWRQVSANTYNEMRAEWVGRIEGSMIVWMRNP